ncbi:hypothetical protein GCM10010172_44010 [Paractinoplanes ferrugineus]|uniref:Uncharacterized protein n=1 Tax=Paractinoplanes ferrugineus TaxID=113564 RepID=A0A919J4L7_9ACTN|nr:hypothetical protein [Actinoplanes ferrugineus]GIE13559.1 hypothetical protein Afe05nite_53990 [Actinoplanes ferrugineus]
MISPSRNKLTSLGPAPNDDSRVTVDYADGTRAAIISVGEWHTDTGLGNGHWTVLVPSAMPTPEP